jgi:23S rRNA pseudouridine1911/1915/1917 synthase
VRAHLEIAGHPLLGDKTYGMPARLLRKMVADPNDPEVLSHLAIPRHALHHQRMAFEHPRTGAPLSLVAPLAVDLAAFLESSRRAAE